MFRVHPFPPVRPSAVSLAAVSLSIALSACGTLRMPPGDTESRETSGAASRTVEPILRQEVERWSGTPHVLGGTSAAGMDCSAFVQRVFADAFDVDLPRTTDEQVETGRRVNLSELQPGDLVFFQPPTKVNHVGIYLDEGEFAHVSSSAGVTVSELDLPYWRMAYWTSRRVLADAPAAAARAETSPPAASPPSTERPAAVEPQGDTGRVGW